jgi:hypothetical protein
MEGAREPEPGPWRGTLGDAGTPDAFTVGRNPEDGIRSNTHFQALRRSSLQMTAMRQRPD